MFWDEEYILNQILEVLNLIRGLGSTALDYANRSNPAVMTVVDALANYAVKPLASILFAMFAVMQLYKAVSYLNDIGAPQGGSARFEVLGLTLAKIGFVYWVITSMDNFMWGLVSAGNWLMDKIQSSGSYAGSQDYAVLENQVRIMLADDTQGQQFLEAMGVNFNLLIIYLLVLACSIVIFILFYARLLQILVMVAFSPIPIVTFIHEEHKQIGIAFIKSFAAVVLQGAVMIAIIYIYSHVITYSMTNATSLTGMVWHAAGYAVLLVVALGTSGMLSKKIVNAV